MIQNFTQHSFDVLILGGGPAGMSCAMWCADLGLSALVIEPAKELGGQLHWTHNPITNHLGVTAANGNEMFEIFSRQLRARDFCAVSGVPVSSVDLADKSVALTDGRTFKGNFIVIATGVSRRKLGIPGESEFIGKGILESGMKARGSVAGKRVVIIGGGDAAVENSLILARSGAEVTLVHRRSEFSCQPHFLAEVRENGGIRLLTDTVAETIQGAEKVTGVGALDLKSGKRSVLATDLVLIRIGVQPNTSFLLNTLKLDAQGYIPADSEQRTSIEGVFAIGDVANPLAPTISSAVGQGAAAAKVIRSLQSR